MDFNFNSWARTHRPVHPQIESQRRWEQSRKHEEWIKSNPYSMFNRVLNKSLKRIYGDIHGVDGGFIGMDSYQTPEDYYGSWTALIRAIYVIPESRGYGIAERLIEKITIAAEDQKVIVLAVCKPFEITYQLDNPENQDNFTRTKFYADLYYDNILLDQGNRWTDYDENKQTRMYNRFTKYGFTNYSLPNDTR